MRSDFWSRGQSVYPAHDYTCHHHPHNRLLVHHRRCAAAKRQRGRYFRSFWRNGQPDGVWSARRCQCAVESDHVVSGHFRPYVDHTIHSRVPPFRPKLGAARREDGSVEVTAGQARGPARHSSTTSPPAEVIIGIESEWARQWRPLFRSSPRWWTWHVALRRVALPLLFPSVILLLFLLHLLFALRSRAGHRFCERMRPWLRRV